MSGYEQPSRFTRKLSRQDKLVRKYWTFFAHNCTSCFGDRCRETGRIACGEGWFDLLERLFEKLIARGLYPNVCFIKEKFGGIRIGLIRKDIMVPDWGEVYRLVAEAEREAYQTCEICGTAGVLRDGGWLRTLCDEHAEARSPRITTIAQDLDN